MMNLILGDKENNGRMDRVGGKIEIMPPAAMSEPEYFEIFMAMRFDYKGSDICENVFDSRVIKINAFDTP